MKAFSKWYWKYLFEGAYHKDEGFLTDIKYMLKRIICRINRHSSGPVWYNSSGFEPDMTCKNCGDEL